MSVVIFFPHAINYLKYVCLVFGLILVASGYSYSKNNVDLYYRLVNDAELNIVAQKYEHAINKYDTAFLNLHPFYNDLYNAMQCALLLHNEKKFFSYAFNIAQKGVGEQYFEKEDFREFKNDKMFNTLLQYARKAQDSLYKKNKAINLKLDSLFKEDQHISVMNQKIIKGDTSFTFAEIYNRADMVSVGLIELFDKYGFLGERTLGVYVDSIIDYYKFDVILIHTMQISSIKSRINIQKKVYDAIQEGIISNKRLEHIAAFPDFFGTDINCKGLYKVYNCYYYKNKTPKYLLSRADYLTSQYLLSSINDLFIKSKYKFENENNFHIGIQINEFKENKDDKDDKLFFERMFEKSTTKVSNCK